MNVTVAVAAKVLEFEMEISHIVTNGCSFTYCQGLPDITNQGWPGLIARQLDCPLVNLGLPGIGNDSIKRRTYEYAYESLIYSDNKPFVIIAWTQDWRREAWQRKHWNDFKFHDYAPISLNEDNPQTNYERAVIEEWSEIEAYRRYLLYKLSVINLLENMNIPYLMTDYSYHDDDAATVVNIKFSKMVEFANSKCIKPFHELVYGTEKLPCGHDGVDAQQIIAEYTIAQIKEKYPNLIFAKHKPYMKLSEFITKDKYHMKFPEWCKFSL